MDIKSKITFKSGFSADSNFKAYFLPGLNKVEIIGRVNGSFTAGTTIWATLNSAYVSSYTYWFPICNPDYKGHIAVNTDGTINVTIDIAQSSIRGIHIEYYL